MPSEIHACRPVERLNRMGMDRQVSSSESLWRMCAWGLAWGGGEDVTTLF